MHDLVKEIILAAKWLVNQGKDSEVIRPKDCLEAILHIEEARNLLYVSLNNDNLEKVIKRPLPESWKEEVQQIDFYHYSNTLDWVVKNSKQDIHLFLSNIAKSTPAKHYGEVRQLNQSVKEENITQQNTVDTTSSKWMNSIASLREALSDVVVGQPHAIEAVCDGLTRKIFRANTETPLATFLFIGASGTGKSLLANKLADALGADWKGTTVQMGSLLGDNQGFAINGLSRGYGTSTHGQVTDFVRKHPRAVVVFENFDKAHPNVLSIVEPLFTSGVLVDQHGFYELNKAGKYDYSKKIAEPEVSFKDAIVIFTTNAGDEAYDSLGFEQLLQNKRDQIEPVLLNALGRKTERNSAEYPPVSQNILSGLATGTTAFFEKLSLDALVVCAERNICRAFEQLKQGLGCDVFLISESLLLKAMLLSFSPNVNALTAGNELVEKLIDPVMDYIRLHQGKVPKQVEIRFVEGQEEILQAMLDELDGDPLKQLFRKNQRLSFDFEIFEDKQVLVLELGGLILQKISHAHDFQGAGAIQAEVPDVGFEDIAGHHVVKKRMAEVVTMLREPQSVKSLGVDVPKGMLLWGPPGTGKTLLAKALAHEADLPFIATTGSELLDLDLMQTIFKRARKYAPSILFIDEVDALGVRGKGGYDVIINQLLIEIDGFATGLSSPVFIIAATNLPEKIDPAVLRSGRIDLKVEVPMLDRDARAYFIEKFFALPHDGSLDREELLSYTSGMSGADLEKVKRETSLALFHSDEDKVNMDMLIEHINTIKYGVRLTHKKLLQSLHATAYHEAGHAIVSMALNPDVLIEQVTVMPRAGALGFVSFEPESLEYRQMNRKEVLDTMSVALAGRMAQSKQFPEHGDDSGASRDLEQATAWAVRAVCQLGMDEKVGNIVLPTNEVTSILAEGGMVFERVQVWFSEAEQQCSSVIEKHWHLIDKLAQRLIEDEVVTGETLRREFAEALVRK